MISFKEFLQESDHKTEISIEEAVRLINTHCREALKNKAPLYRGMRGNTKVAFILHGEASTRKSANTSNYYTVILDHFLPSRGYPKRSESIILSTDADTAEGFGRVHAIFPYDGVKIGVCHTYDLWRSPGFSVGNSEDKHQIKNWNNVWAEYELSSESYESFVASIKQKMGEDTKVSRMLTDIFGTVDNIEPALKKAYSPNTLGMDLATPKTIDSYSSDRELWIGGKCIAIELSQWQKIQKDEHDDEPAPEDDQ